MGTDSEPMACDCSYDDYDHKPEKECPIDKEYSKVLDDKVTITVPRSILFSIRKHLLDGYCSKTELTVDLRMQIARLLVELEDAERKV